MTGSRQVMEMKSNLTAKDSYPLYKVLCESKPVSIGDFKKIFGLFCKFMLELVKEGHTITLPSKMGQVGIVGRKKKMKLDKDGNIVGGLAPNWPETNKLWASCPECKERKEYIYYLNEHTNNVKYKIVWAKKDIIVPNKNLYSLQFTRHNKRASSELMKAGKEYTVLLPKEELQVKRSVIRAKARAEGEKLTRTPRKPPMILIDDTEEEDNTSPT